MNQRPEFEILCVTMNQSDFSKLQEMNIHSNVVFANQCNRTEYEKICYDGCHTAEMISTETRGVGINRNLALLYAKAEYCLFADDDVNYKDNAEEIILREFKAHPKADVFIFHLDTDSKRKQKKYEKTRIIRPWERESWGAVRIAVRLDSVRKKNIGFTTLFGGGSIFPSGEDSLWVSEARKKGLVFYVSKETIGQVSFSQSSWFTGCDEKFFFGKGAFCAAAKRRPFFFWSRYYIFRIAKDAEISPKDAMKAFRSGVLAYRNLQPFAPKKTGEPESE